MQSTLPLLGMVSVSALAQSDATTQGVIQEQMLVVGQGASMDEAIRKQRLADSIKSVISADAVAQLPDENIAEAVQRLPGVSVERDQGEGRFVSVRGLGPDLNSVQINGTTIPSPNSDTRAVALDVLPSELVETLSVVKAVTPDMDANSLGGSIAVESLTAFDRDNTFYTFSTEGNYDDNKEEYSGKLSGAFSNQFSILGGENNLGVALAFSWQERDFGSDNVEIGGAWDFDEAAALEESEMRDYTITRERSGAGLNLDYKFNGNAQMYLRTLYSEFTDTETREAAGVEFADAVTSGSSSEAEGWREVKDREETQKIESYVFGGDWDLDTWRLSAQLGFSESSEDTPNHIAGAVFEGTDVFADMGVRSYSRPVLVGPEAFYDASQFELAEVEWTDQLTTDQETNLKFDISHDYQIGSIDATIKGGAKRSEREKDNNTNVYKYEDFADFGIADDQLLMTAYSGAQVDYSLGAFGPSINAAGLRGLISGLQAEEFWDEEESRIEDFVMNEDITAAYLMNTFERGAMHAIVGLRYEATEFKARGTGLNGDDYESISAGNDYDHWLPGVHVRYELNDDTQFRFAFTNTVVRPSFEQLAPGFVIDGEEASFGNPELEALESVNWDLGVERYLGRAGVISAFVFYKEIDNFIYATDIAGTGAWVDFDQAETFANGNSADLYGLELAWSQQLSHLSTPWNGLLLAANLTLSDSDASIGNGGDSRDIDMPYMSDTVANAMLGWENNKLSLRLSANFKSEYLQEVAGLDDAAHDLYVDEQTFIDFTAHYFVTPQLNINLEVQNITDEAYYVYTGSRGFNAQYEEYGPTVKLGITFVSM
ncbi:TonB-dependent receptor [Halioxenophilus aromaticivorans]